MEDCVKLKKLSISSLKASFCLWHVSLRRTFSLGTAISDLSPCRKLQVLEELNAKGFLSSLLSKVIELQLTR
jgi:hypothetical protein